MRASALALMAALAALLAAPLGAAQEPVEDVAWRLDARVVAMAAQGDAFTFSSSRASELGDDLLSGAFQPDPPRLQARFTAQDPDPTEAVLQVEWRELVEYRDADGDGRLGLADPVVQRIPLAGLSSSTAVAPVLGGRSATVTYTLPSNSSGSSPLPVPGDDPTLRIIVTLVGSPATIGGRSLVPTDLGLAVQLHRFPYADDSSLVALVSEVASPAAVETGSGQVGVEAQALSFRLGWDAARADGVASPASATATSASPGRAQMVQSLPRGDDASQDGSIRTQRWTAADVLEALPPGDWRFYALGVAAVAVGLGVPSLRRLRDREA